MRVQKISADQFTLDCINKEFSIINAGLHFNTLEELKEWSKENENWFSDNSFSTIEQYNEWRDYFVTHFYDWKPKYIKKRVAESEFLWFDLMYGFKSGWD